MRFFILILSIVLFTPSLFSRDTKAGNWQISFTPQYISAKSLNFEDKGEVNINDRSGWGFGIGYFVSPQISLDLSFLSTTGGYNGSVKEANGTISHYAGNMYSSSVDFSITYDFIDDNFTPFVSANIGSSFIDSGVPTGNYYGGTCYDPWYGYYYPCYTTETHTTVKFHYGTSVGLRYDFKNRLFVKGGINANVLDFSSEQFPYFMSYQLSIGSTFH